VNQKPDLVQTALRLPSEMLDRLRQSEQGVSEEIRSRLARSFAEERIDPTTRELANDIIQLAEWVRLDVAANWNSDPGAHATFRSAVIALIDEHQPEGAPVFGAVRALFGAGISKSDDPETLGRALVRHYRRSKPNPQAVQPSKMGRLAKHIAKKGDKS
jgi:hypothetical protein